MSLNSQSPIGMTDSGVGGLSVLLAALESLPSERFVFLADQAWIPYGDKPVHEISARLHHVSGWFRSQDCKALVLACNTATAAAANALRQLYPAWPIVGIEPAVKPAAMMSKTGQVGILATTNTLASDKFRNLVSRFDSVAEVDARPCPGLVELIEAQPINRKAVADLLSPIIEDLKDQNVDVLVLGCTHYPFVRSIVADLAGPDVQIIETGQPVARQLANRLQDQQLLAANSGQTGSWQKVQFYTTGEVEPFQLALIGLLGPEWAHAKVQKVAI